MTLIKEDSMRLRQAAFCIETVAHLNHLERELLPLADALREIAERAYPTARFPAGVGAGEAQRVEVALAPEEISRERRIASALADPEWIQFKETEK